MKRTRIAAVLTALMLLTGTALSGCKKDETTVAGSGTGLGSDSSVSSDTGISLSIDPNITDPSNMSSTPSFMKMTYEDNYDQAAINEMNKIVSIHGMQFTALDYNFFFANEYAQVVSLYMQGTSVPVTGSGFLDMEGYLTEDLTVKKYLQDLVIADLQGEVFLLEYAQSKNLTLDESILNEIDKQFEDMEASAESYGLTMDEYMKSYYGPDATTEGMRAIMQRYELVNAAMNKYVEEYPFTEDEKMLPTVYHILYPTIDLSTRTSLSEDEIAAAKAKAEALKDSVTSLDDMKTKGSEAIASGDAAEAAQYTVQVGEMVPQFEEWCFAEHEVGDVGIVETMFGYHVMYFVGKDPAAADQLEQLAYTKLQDDMDAAIASGDYDPVFSS
ncbi:MAG: peptidylprolyl isomerase [Clostridiales bacterium]|nr:peptidylprolyl isomerase [Clostridiales bacterium]